MQSDNHSLLAGSPLDVKIETPHGLIDADFSGRRIPGTRKAVWRWNEDDGKRSAQVLEAVVMVGSSTGFVGWSWYMIN